MGTLDWTTELDNVFFFCSYKLRFACHSAIYPNDDKSFWYFFSFTVTIYWISIKNTGIWFLEEITTFKFLEWSNTDKLHCFQLFYTPFFFSSLDSPWIADLPEPLSRIIFLLNYRVETILWVRWNIGKIILV